MKRTGSTLAALAAAAVLGTGSAFAADSPLLVRVGAHNVDPKSDNTDIGVSVDSRLGPTFNIDWYFTPHLALDILAALPFKHDLTANGDKIGSATHLPPTVSLQYHFAPGGRIDPYVALGVNYTMFWDTKLDDGTALDLDNSFGLAGQIGVDFAVAPKWVVGADLRYIDIDTDADIGNGAVKTTVEIDPLVYGINVGYRF
ncbi:OmpW family outer membrane protein [Fontimonas sp. SYSU GA230001]|uniref:OmpW/AlkL family protein n=1 Tax=Fontimonas sp. SYSU GA230001 TaxID=3142450 RepID=UPI0032B42CC0